MLSTLSRIGTVCGVQTAKKPPDLILMAKARQLAASGEARALRIRHRVSGPEMATALGVSPTTLWRWEQGERRPQGEAAVRWAQLLSDLADGGVA